MTKQPLVLKSVDKLASVMTPSLVSGSFHNIALPAARRGGGGGQAYILQIGFRILGVNLSISLVLLKFSKFQYFILHFS